MTNRMVELAAAQPGFLGMESVRENLGITVSYWESLESITNWKRMLSIGKHNGSAIKNGAQHFGYGLQRWSASMAFNQSYKFVPGLAAVHRTL